MKKDNIWWRTLKSMFQTGSGGRKNSAGLGHVIEETPPARGQEGHMKILVMSDSHSRDANVRTAVEREKPFDALIHLGDSQEEEEEFCSVILGLKSSSGGEVPVYMVRGNCDYLGDFPTERIVVLGGHRILLAHGHTHYVNFGTDELVNDAAENSCDIAMYGHTHRPDVDWTHQGVLVLNPGSISYPRQQDHRASYMVVELEPGSEPDVELRYV